MPSTDEEDTTRNPLTQPAFLASSVVVALIVVLGLVLAFSGSEQDGVARSPTPNVTGSQAQKAPTARDDGPCDLPVGNQAIPTSAPETKWELKGTVAVPRSPATFGPATVEDEIPSCFARSPTGALFATVNIFATLSSASERPFEDQLTVLRQYAATGRGRDRALRDARDDGTTAASGSSAGVQVAGFSIVRYEPTTAVVDVAFRVARGTATALVHAASTLRWQGDDWKIVLSDSGRPYDSLQQISSLDGYVPWSGT